MNYLLVSLAFILATMTHSLTAREAGHISTDIGSGIMLEVAFNIPGFNIVKSTEEHGIKTFSVEYPKGQIELMVYSPEFFATTPGNFCGDAATKSITALENFTHCFNAKTEFTLNDQGHLEFYRAYQVGKAGILLHFESYDNNEEWLSHSLTDMGNALAESITSQKEYDQATSLASREVKRDLGGVAFHYSFPPGYKTLETWYDEGFINGLYRAEYPQGIIILEMFSSDHLREIAELDKDKNGLEARDRMVSHINKHGWYRDISLYGNPLKDKAIPVGEAMAMLRVLSKSNDTTWMNEQLEAFGK